MVARGNRDFPKAEQYGKKAFILTIITVVVTLICCLLIIGILGAIEGDGEHRTMCTTLSIRLSSAYRAICKFNKLSMLKALYHNIRLDCFVIASLAAKKFN